jgi:hypothetical protein
MLQNCVIGDNGAATVAGLMAEAVAIKDTLALSKLRLFKSGSVVYGQNTTLAALVLVECDYTGYAAGGVEIAAFNDPYLEAETGKVMLTSPLVQFNTADVVTADNEVGGAFLVDADGALRGVCRFDPPITMAGPTDSIPVVVTRQISN